MFIYLFLENVPTFTIIRSDKFPDLFAIFCFNDLKVQKYAIFKL